MIFEQCPALKGQPPTPRGGHSATVIGTIYSFQYSYIFRFFGCKCLLFIKIEVLIRFFDFFVVKGVKFGYLEDAMKCVSTICIFLTPVHSPFLCFFLSTEFFVFFFMFSNCFAVLENNTWKEVHGHGKKPAPRWGHSCTAVHNPLFILFIPLSHFTKKLNMKFSDWTKVVYFWRI